MASESKNTSWPKGPAGLNVAPVLATNVMASANATGRSMVMRPARSPLAAATRIGPAENNITGSASNQLPQFSNWRMSGVSSPGPAT